MAVIWAKLFIECHHVPLLPAVSSLPHLLHLPLKGAAFHASLLFLGKLDGGTEKGDEKPPAKHIHENKAVGIECALTLCLRLSFLLSSVS